MDFPIDTCFQMAKLSSRQLEKQSNNMFWQALYRCGVASSGYE